MNHAYKKWITLIGIILLLAAAWFAGAYQQNPYWHKQWWQSFKQTVSQRGNNAQAQIEQQTLQTAAALAAHAVSQIGFGIPDNERLSALKQDISLV